MGQDRRLGRGTKLIIALLVALVAAGALPILEQPKPAAAAYGNRPIPGPLTVKITNAGFVPAVVGIVAGQTVYVDNETAVNQTYTATDGWLDSGTIVPGGRFVFTPAVGTLGNHPVTSTPTPAFSGTVSIGLLDLPDNGSNFVTSTTLTQWASPTNAGDIHPKWGVVASRNRALVTFSSSASITQASAAFEAAHVNVIGAKKNYGLVAVEVPDSGVRGDFAALDAAIATLRTKAGVTSVSYDFGLAPEATVPRPAAPDPGAAPMGEAPGASYAWTWEDTRTATGAPSGTGGNSGMEASNVAEAWNLMDYVTSLTTTQRPDVAALDHFTQTDHPDVPYQVVDVCAITGSTNGCSATPDPGAHHGNSVASIIGAPYDRDSTTANRSTGMQGVNPAVDLFAVEAQKATYRADIEKNAVFMVDFMGMLDNILSAKNTAFPRLRALNVSLGGVLFADQNDQDADGAVSWALMFAGKLCGPGFNDDAAATEPCTPNNEDSFNREIAAAGEVHRGVVTAYGSNNVLLVQSAGNESALKNAACLPYNAPSCTPIKLRSDAVVPLVRLEKIWGSGTPAILSVSAYNTTVDPGVPTRDSYSNIGADVSAPGLNNLAARLNDPNQPSIYEKFAGTSAAAPFVTGLASYLAGLRQPTFLSYVDIRRIIINTARNDVADDGPPRIDAYAASMNLPGSTVRMVDVNDPSADGNRRVIYDENGTFVGDDMTIAVAGKRGTAADGKVDIRDLRRYRDAYYRYCSTTGSGEPSCPDETDILLDGDEYSNPHYDLNLDGCIAVCVNDDFSRFDFNGDGALTNEASPVPIVGATGAPMTPPATTALTDLDVLKSVWGSGTSPQTQGWSQAQVTSLLKSADVQVETADLFTQGATKVEITGLSGPAATPSPVVTLTAQPAQPAVISIPVNVADPGPGGEIRVLVKITWADGSTVQWISAKKQVRLGQDVVVRPCSNQLDLFADRDKIRAGDLDVEITAQLNDCFGTGELDLSNRPVTFEITDGAAGVLTDPQEETDANGYAHVTFSAADDFDGEVTVKATVDVDGFDLTAERVLGISDPPTIWYAWRQTNLEYDRDATNDNGGVGDDCRADLASAGSAHCFTSTQSFDYDNVFADNVYGAERRGSIRPGASGSDVPLVTEAGRFFSDVDGTSDDLSLTLDGERATNQADPFAVHYRVEHRLSSFPTTIGGQLWSQPYVDQEVPDLGVSYDADGVVLDNLAAIGDELYYPTTFVASPLASSEMLPEMDMPIMASRAPSEVLLTRRDDRSSFQFADDLDTSIALAQFDDGTYDSYEWCGVVTKDFASIPDGYYSDSDPWLWGLRPSELRAPTRTAGSRYAPTYTGNWKARFELVMVATDGSAPTEEQLAFSGCTDTEPAASLEVDPEPVKEGADTTLRVAQAASLPNLTYDWKLGDGVESELAEVTHSYDDNGTYPVEVTRSSNGQAVNQLSRDIVVQNVAPEIDNFDDVFGQQEPALRMNLSDPGPIDAQALTVTVTSLTPGFVAPAARQFPAGLVEFPMGEQTPGSYTIKVTVTDKDGGTVSDTALVWVPTAEEAGSMGSLMAPDTGSGDDGFSAQAMLVDEPEASASPSAVPGPVARTNNGASPAGALESAPVAAAATPAALDSKPVIAYTLTPKTGTTGSNFTVKNRSRAGGVPLAATLSAGDGRATAPIGADTTMAVSYLEPGTFTLALTGGAPATTSGSPVTVTGASLVPTLTYGPGGATSGAQGALVTVRAKLVTPSNAGVGGRTTTFTLGTSTASTITDSDGFATTTVVVPNTPGLASLVVVVPAAGASPERNVTVPFTIAANNAPIVVSGGPYEVGLNGDLVLNASGSSDPDAGQTATLQYAWDLDGDGNFADDVALGTGSQPAPISWADVQAVVCHGTCTIDQTYSIGLRVTDSAGAVTLATAQVSVLKDFGLSISPANATLVPGSNRAFTVSVFSNSGFTTPVALSTVGLPTGVSGSFSPSPVAPGGTSILTLSASASATDTDFSLVVKGVAGGLTRQAGGAIDMEFGLVPTCYGQVKGKVIDARTGAPIAGANVSSSGATNAAGEFTSGQLSLNAGNATKGYTLSVSAAGHFQKGQYVTAVCGTVPYYTVALNPIDTITISGTVRTAEAPKTPIVGASVGYPFSSDYVTGGVATVAGGTYTRSYTLGEGQTENNLTLRAGVADRHTADQAIVARVGENLTGVDFELEKRCYAKIQARAINKDTGKPIPSAQITFSTLNQTFTAGADGRATSTDISLAKVRAPIEVQVQARTPSGTTPNVGSSKNIMLSGCGVTVPVDILIDYPDAQSTASLDVTVLDDETGLPIPDANVGVRFNPSTADLGFPKTNATGHSVKTVEIGAGVTTKQVSTIYASKTDYNWKSTTPSTVTLTKDQTSTTTVRLQKQRYGAVEGTVRDKVTGLPIAGVRPRAGGEYSLAVTGADGRYRIEHIQLGLDSAEVSVSITVAEIPGYWGVATPYFKVGPTLVTKDIEMVPVCASATIRGRIVDATTRLPIPTARASTYGSYDDVDADGRFVLNNIEVGQDNVPRTVTVSASASGYQTASKTVTVFCGANVVIDFGTDQDGTGTIVGTVTSEETGQPVAGAFVGTEFGGSDTTDAQGKYEITQAPAGPNGTARNWVVTVVPTLASGLGEAEKTAAVTKNQTTTVDFALGEYVEPPPDNVAPVAAIVASPAATVVEGSTISLSAATSFDPDSSPGGLAFAWDLDNDGQYDDGSAVTASVQRPDNGTVTVKVQVTDAGTVPGPLSDTETLALTFTNAVPVVSTTGGASSTVSRRVDIGATFTDVGAADTHTATIDWGDGSSLQAVAVDQATDTVATTAHVYATLGVRTVEVCVTDDDADKGCKAITVTSVGVVPGPPIDVSAVGGDANARLKWKAPLSDGGSALLQYEIETTPGGSKVTIAASELTRLMEPLVNGSDYTFKVRASNEYGWGPWSAPSNLTRPRSSCAGSAFSDVGSEHPFCPEIKWMGDKGVSRGYADGTYKPTAVITRQAMAAFSYRLLNPGDTPPACTAKPFSDVELTNPFCAEITWMKDSGISTGYPDGTFRPGAPVARQAMAAFLYRLDGSPLGEEPACIADEFTDVTTVHPFCGEIRWLVGTGVAEGYQDGSYGATASVARQAMAAFIYRYNIYAALIP